MSTRKQFIGHAGSALISMLLFPFPGLPQGEPAFEGLVVNDDEGEGFQMRDGTAIVRIKVARRMGAESIAFLSEIFQPGDALPVHKHMNEDEVIFIHKGAGVFTLGSRRYPISEGAVAFVPKGVWHGLENNGTGPIDMRFCYSPSGFEGFFREVGTPVGHPFVRRTMQERRAIAQKWGMIYKS